MIHLEEAGAVLIDVDGPNTRVTANPLLDLFGPHKFEVLPRI